MSRKPRTGESAPSGSNISGLVGGKYNMIGPGKTPLSTIKACVETLIDATLGTPFNIHPLAAGIDYVLHSATKYIGGHHDLIGGVVCCSDAGRATLRDAVIDTGGTFEDTDTQIERVYRAILSAHGRQ